MKKIYLTKEEFVKDSDVIKFTAALREFSEAIAFTELHIKHEVETKEGIYTDCFGNVLFKDEAVVADYFTLDVTQGENDACMILSDITLPEQPLIYLSQCEFDMLETNDQKVGKKFGDFKTYINMQNAGWFKDVPTDMYVNDIIKHCKIKED